MPPTATPPNSHDNYVVLVLACTIVLCNVVLAQYKYITSCVWYLHISIYTVGVKRADTNHHVIYNYAFDLKNN